MNNSTPQLSLVLVCYEMKRELPRTLISLSSNYQQLNNKLLVEIIVVDNGSSSPVTQNDIDNLDLDPHLNIKLLSCSSLSKSPVPAINEGLAHALAPLIGVWIDAARLASPGLLNACLNAAKLHHRPIIATLNYQLGPQLQYLASQNGYNQSQEDSLLEQINWPHRPYELFNIATPEFKRGETGPFLESNALFMPASMWQELKGYDPQFDEAGGGCANPDVLRRALKLTDSQLIRILGEGTFHQIHSGTTTSDLKQALNVLKNSSAKYYRLRGQALSHVRELGLLYDSKKKKLLNAKEVSVL